LFAESSLSGNGWTSLGLTRETPNPEHCLTGSAEPNTSRFVNALESARSRLRDLLQARQLSPATMQKDRG